jgi:hypothetical protein
MTTKPNAPTDPKDQPGPPQKARGGGGAEVREERLKAALKANMARRKAQARARTKAAEAAPDTDNK